MRTFHLSDILSITTGRLVSTRHMDGVVDILSYMCGADLFTHQLPLAVRRCAPVLLQQHPQLAGLPADFPDSEFRVWLDQQVAWFGAELPVAPLGYVFYPSFADAMTAARVPGTPP